MICPQCFEFRLDKGMPKAVPAMSLDTPYPDAIHSVLALNSLKLTGKLQKRADQFSELGRFERTWSVAQRDLWFVLPVTDYLSGPPLSYYSEPAFAEYALALQASFPGPKQLAQQAREIRGLMDAIHRAEHLAFEVEHEDLENLDTRTAVRNHLSRWYLELCDQILDVLLALPARGEARSSGKTAPIDLFSIAEFLKKAGWHTADVAYSPTVRNGCAHDLTFSTEFAGRHEQAIFTDKKGNSEKRTLEEFRDDVTSLLDRSLGYSLALRLYLNEHLGVPAIARIVDPTKLAPETRRWCFSKYASGSDFDIPKATVDTVRGERQLTVEIADKATHSDERLVTNIGVLWDAAVWFPEAQRVFVGAKADAGTSSFSVVDGRALSQWASGRLPDREFIQGAQNLYMSFGGWIGRFRHKLRYIKDAVTPEWRARLQRDRVRLRIVSADDISTGEARRYRVEAVLEETASEDSIAAALRGAIESSLKMRIHRNDQSRKRWGKARPHYVSVMLYAREKRARDRFADPSSSFYLGRAEYRDPRFKGVLPDAQLKETDGKGVSIALSPNWTRSITVVPATGA